MYSIVYQPKSLGYTYYIVGPFDTKEEAGRYAKAAYNDTKETHKWIVAPMQTPVR
jgi:hypothetical protein